MKYGLRILKKQQEELIAKKIELDEDYELVLSKIKENEKILDLLDEEDSSYFSDFTPRDINQKTSPVYRNCNNYW